MGLLDTGGNVLMLTVWRGSKHVNGAVHGRDTQRPFERRFERLLEGFWYIICYYLLLYFLI